MEAKRFLGKVALVTGAGKGIGRAIAVALSQDGATVHALSRTQADLDSFKQEVPEMGLHRVDLSDWDVTRHLVESIGTVDLLVNNAAVLVSRNFLEVTQDDYDRIFDTNVKAVINISQVVAKGMVSSGKGGSIVNVSSIAGLHPEETRLVYGASKAAMDFMTKALALELGKHKIRVNSVNPTGVMTKMGKGAWGDPEEIEKRRLQHPLQRFAEVEDVVNTVMFLLSDKAAMITGSVLPVDGGVLQA